MSCLSRSFHVRAGPAALVVLLISGSVADGQRLPGAPGGSVQATATSSAATVDEAQLRRLIGTLEDPVKREELLANLRALLAAQGAAPTAPEATPEDPLANAVEAHFAAGGAGRQPGGQDRCSAATTAVVRELAGGRVARSRAGAPVGSRSASVASSCSAPGFRRLADLWRARPASPQADDGYGPGQGHPSRPGASAAAARSAARAGLCRDRLCRARVRAARAHRAAGRRKR